MTSSSSLPPSTSPFDGPLVARSLLSPHAIRVNPLSARPATSNSVLRPQTQTRTMAVDSISFQAYNQAKNERRKAEVEMEFVRSRLMHLKQAMEVTLRRAAYARQKLQVAQSLHHNAEDSRQMMEQRQYHHDVQQQVVQQQRNDEAKRIRTEDVQRKMLAVHIKKEIQRLKREQVGRYIQWRRQMEVDRSRALEENIRRKRELIRLAQLKQQAALARKEQQRLYEAARTKEERRILCAVELKKRENLDEEMQQLKQAEQALENQLATAQRIQMKAYLDLEQKLVPSVSLYMQQQLQRKTGDSLSHLLLSSSSTLSSTSSPSFSSSSSFASSSPAISTQMRTRPFSSAGLTTDDKELEVLLAELNYGMRPEPPSSASSSYVRDRVSISANQKRDKRLVSFAAQQNPKLS
eukprot:TRINITY_DN5209_c0_g1_i1.p1 TRINITY_DN5209_c0_g1~~TRINITY_DN5209_c0_g1_i1.p1  ORF type:complete len:408 (-),score=108.24 TRINITY_DN5209_c0_g1_i1:26-1249(-)